MSEIVDMNQHADLLVERIANTYSIAWDALEAMQHPRDLDRFLLENGAKGADKLTDHNLQEFRLLRSELRAVFEAPNNDVALSRINRLLQGVNLSLHLHGKDSGVDLAWEVQTLDHPIKSLRDKAAVELAFCAHEFGVGRMRICESSPCSDVFIDRSKKGQKRFCNVTCASRYHVTSFRKRQRSKDGRDA